jgi:NAD(P)-dependent dehydrogenase (short-subunit alcohol dehydrogenase family)
LELFDLSGRIALVTGSSKGIGRAIVCRFAEHGARVVVTARHAADCEAVAADINGRHRADTAIALPCDIAVSAQLERLVEQTYRRFGRLDILVCNAALNPYRGPSAAISDETFRAILETNVIGNNLLTQLVLSRMAADGGGSIIILATTGAFRGSRQYGAYCLSKAALVQLARNIAVEYGQHNIRANCIAPGPVRTDMARELLDNPRAHQRLKDTSPLRRIGEPDEIAGVAVFLAAKASSFMTGQTLIVDGGLSA